MLSSSCQVKRQEKRISRPHKQPNFVCSFPDKRVCVCGSLLSSIDVEKKNMSCKMTADHILRFKASARKLFSSLFKSQLEGFFSNMYEVALMFPLMVHKNTIQILLTSWYRGFRLIIEKYCRKKKLMQNQQIK